MPNNRGPADGARTLCAMVGSALFLSVSGCTPAGLEEDAPARSVFAETSPAQDPPLPPPLPAGLAPVFTSSDAHVADEKKRWTGYQALVSPATRDGVSFHVAGGEDGALFEIDSATGYLAFIEAPVFDSPADLDRDNTYKVKIAARGPIRGTVHDLAVRVRPEHLIDYVEEFAVPGEPSPDPSLGLRWSFVDDMRPVASWTDIVPGDGYAHIVIDSDPGNDTDPTRPFQDIRVKFIHPGHRIEIFAKDLVEPGVTGFLFTYRERFLAFDEIDIEVVADDSATPPANHPIDPPSGWTDARFNTWGRSYVLPPYLPETSIKRPVRNELGHDISLRDDQFHIFTINWRHEGGPDDRDGRVDFLIDGVPQARIDWPVGRMTTEAIVGFRQLSWAGEFELLPGETHTLLVDWLRIAPMDAASPTALQDRYEVVAGQALTVSAPGPLENDDGANLFARLATGPRSGSLILNDDGGFIYTPDPGFIGRDSFAYRASDGTDKGDSNTALVWLDVQ